MESKWCEHIRTKTYSGIEWWLECNGISYGVESTWNLCPICGTPRPPKEKELWEKFQDKFGLENNCKLPNYEYWSKQLAQIAKEHYGR